jgi:IS30 family transposase
MLFPEGHGAPAVRKALAKRIVTLPTELRRSITWDQGKEMAEHLRFPVDTDVQIYFCYPKSPWQPLATRLQQEHERGFCAVNAQAA